MFIHAQKLNNIRSFKLINRSIVVENLEGKLLLNNEELISDNVNDYFINGKHIYYNDEFDCKIFDIGFKSINNMKNQLVINVETRLKNIWLFIDVETKTRLKLLDFQQNSETLLIDNYDWEFLYLTKSHLYLSNSFITKSLPLNAGKYEWQTDLSDYGEFRKIIGLEVNKLWVSMYRAGANRDEKQLLAIDIKTGKIDFQLDKSLPISDWFVEKIEEKHTLLSIYGKISTAPADSLLVEIDAKTGAVIRNERIESLYKENLKIGFWRVLDDKIYFTANKDMLNGTHIGVLDYHSLELLWFTKVKDSKAGFRDFQVSEDKIYVLDQGNQLHIFEKEDSST